MSQYYRRMEAIPLDWNSLSEQQRNAVEAVSGWLVDALASIPSIDSRSEKSWHSGPILDHNRRSQLGFIDGDRGTGKSSVLLTLQALTTEKDYSFSTELPDDNSIRELRNQRSRIVWLETLDMEPLSKGANLFAAILARIEQELDTNLGELPPMAAALIEPDGYAGAADKLRQLQNDAAIVWDRMDGGVYNSDPQTRALWIKQAEKAGLELNPRIGKVLEAMARARWNRKDQNPLFVLPVDDFDLAPCHCLELLRLIRMVTTPRLFFLVAGNTRIAEAVLKLRTEGDLLSLTNGKPSSPDEVREYAIEIAANNMRKLLPPGQRARLATLRINEALDLRTNTKEGSLRTKLDAIKFEVNQAPTNHAEMSMASFLLPMEGLTLTIAEWLASTPRQTLDRIEMFEQLAKSGNSRLTKDQYNDRLVVWLFEEIQREIREDALIPYNLRDKLVETFDTSLSISLDLSYLSVTQRNSYKELNNSNDFKLVNLMPVDIRVSVAAINDISGQQSRFAPFKKEKNTALHQHLGACLLFAHDFTISLWGGYLQHSSLAYSSKFGPSVETHWKTGDQVYTEFEWPFPEWWTFRDIDRFAKHWSLHVDQCEGHYGLAWLAAILEVVLNEECEPGSKGLLPSRLRDFLKKLCNEKPTRIARSLLRDSTLVAIALLLAPESQSDIGTLELEHSKTGFLTAIKAPALRNRIRDARARRWWKAWNKGFIDTPERLWLCEVIAPGMTRDFIINEIIENLNGLLMPDDLRSAIRQNLDQSKKEKVLSEKVLSVLERLKGYLAENSQHYQGRGEIIRLSQLLSIMDFKYNIHETLYSLRDSSFNNLEKGAFVPTEKDVRRIQ